MEVIILNQLKKLKMLGLQETFSERISQALNERWSYSEFLEILLSDEIERRDNKQLTGKLTKSRLSMGKTLETFDFNFNPKVPASLIKELALCTFIEKKQNIFILGSSGVGKSHLAHALGHQACRKGYDVLFYSAHELFDWIHSGRGDGTHKKKFARVVKVPLLIIDDFGLLELNEAQQSDLYQLIAGRYEKTSTIIVSNQELGEWLKIFKNPFLGSAVLDRLVHRGIQIVIEGTSFCLSEFKKATAALEQMSAIKS